MIDFLKYRRVCLLVSVVFFATGIVAYFVKGGFKYHIDFAGGTELRVKFDKQLASTQIRNLVSTAGFSDAIIQSIGSDGTEFLIRVSESSESVEDRFSAYIAQELPDNRMIIRHVEWVGAEVGKDIKWNALISVILSLLLIMLYVAVRSRYRFAVGAVVAIAHDMIAVLIYFLIFGEPISLHVLAAVLAILGYSLNDTIVIFSRVRENFAKMKGVSEEEIVNKSINQTLSRTLLTSFSTLLAVGSIFFLGGEALHGFSLAMLIGIVVGTYSSVYIASPVMLALGSPANK